MNTEPRKMNPGAWPRIVTVLLLGYMCMGRSFSYLGIPPLYIFVAEVVLAWFLVFGPRIGIARWPWSAMRLPRLKNLNRLLYLLLAYGAIQIVHGIYAGYPPLTAMRDFAFDYYPLYFFLGLWAGLRQPQGLPGFFRIFAWANGIYGTAYVLFLNRLSWTIPGVSQQVAPVPVFGLPEYSCIALLGLLAFEKSLRRAWPLLLLNGFVLLGMQVRAEWLAFAVGLGIWAWRTGNLKRAAWGGAVVVVMLGFFTVTNFSLAGPEGRGGGSISAGGLVGRALAPVSADLAANYTAHYQTDVDTTLFRTLWWAAIWQAVHERASRALLGFGYGYPLGDLVPYLKGEFIQTPHNAFFYALGYTGWLGVVLFFWFLAEIFRLLLAVPNIQLRHFGVAAFAVFFTISMFTAVFEAPYGAIPFYLIAGLAVAPSFSRQPAESHPGMAVKRGRKGESVPAVAT